MDNKQVGGVVNLGGGIDTYTPLENNAKVEIPAARKPLAVTQPVVQPTTTPNLNTNVLDDAKLNAAIDKSINNLSFTPEDTRYIPDLLTIGPKGNKGIKPTAGLEIGQLEEYAASTQTWGDRMWNDSKVAGAGIALGAATAFTSIYDMVKEGTFSPGANSITAGLNNEYAQYTEENRNYENAYDKANPIMSMVLPSFITGSSKGWGELIKSASMGLGTLGGIALQEVLITAATAGTGTIPTLALNIKRLINGSETVLQIAKGAGALKAAAQASLGVEKSLKLGNALAKITPTLRDVRIGLVGAIGESEFEANEARTVMRTKYINDYYEQTGKLPNPEDVGHAEKVGEKAHDFRYALNVATLMLTNDRMLGSLFKPFSSVVKFQDKLIAKNLTSLLDDAGKVIYKDKLLASNVWNRLKYGAEIKKGLEKALPILRSAGTHITLNEGLEEGLQFLYQKGTDNYFTPFLNEKNNESVKESFLNTASGVLAEIYNNKGEVFSTEGLQNIVGGIMGGTLQSIGSYGVNSFGVEKVKSTNKEGKEVSSYKFVNRKKEADELFEEEKIKAGTEIEKSIKDLTAIVMDHKSLNSTPRESLSTLNATVHADNIGSQIKDPILYDLQQDQKKFNILLPLAKSGYAEVAIDLLKEQFDSMSDAAFSAYTGVEIKSKAQKDSIVNTITEDFNKVVKAHSTVDANFRHAIKANTEQHARYNLLKDALTYHQYSIENLNSKVNDYQVSSDVTSTNRLMQGFVNKDLTEFQTLRESVTAELSSVSQQIALTVEANKTATVKASTAELNKIQKQLEEKNNLLTETAQLVKNSDDKTVNQIVKNIHKLGGNEKEADDIQANKILTEALSYKTLKDTYTHHVDTFNKLLYTETKDLDDTFLDFMNEASETNDLVFEVLGQLVKTEEQNRRSELIKNYNLSKKNITKLEQLEASRPNANTEDLIKQILEEDKQEIEEARLKAEEAEKLRLEAELEASKKSKVHSPKTKKDFFALVPILTDDHIVKIGGLPFSVKVDEEYDAIDFNSDEGLAFALAISTKDITDMTETEGPVLDALNLFFNGKAKPVPVPVPVPITTIPIATNPIVPEVKKPEPDLKEIELKNNIEKAGIDNLVSTNIVTNVKSVIKGKKYLLVSFTGYTGTAGVFSIVTATGNKKKESSVSSGSGVSTQMVDTFINENGVEVTEGGLNKKIMEFPSIDITNNIEVLTFLLYEAKNKRLLSSSRSSGLGLQDFNLTKDKNRLGFLNSDFSRGETWIDYDDSNRRKNTESATSFLISKYEAELAALKTNEIPKPIAATLPDYKIKTKQYEDKTPTIESKTESGALELIVNPDGTVMWTPTVPSELNEMYVDFINKRPDSEDLKLGTRVLNEEAKEKEIAIGDDIPTAPGVKGLVEKGLNFNLSNLDKKPIYTVHYTFTEGKYKGRTIEVGSFRDEKAFQVSEKAIGWLAVRFKNENNPILKPLKDLLDRKDQIISWNELLTTGLPLPPSVHTDILTALYGAEKTPDFKKLQESMARATDNYNKLTANPTIEEVLKNYELDQVNFGIVNLTTNLNEVGANSFIINNQELNNVIRISNRWYTYDGTAYQEIDSNTSDDLQQGVLDSNEGNDVSGSITLGRIKSYHGKVSFVAIGIRQSDAYKQNSSIELDAFLRITTGTESEILDAVNKNFLIKAVDSNGRDLFEERGLGSFKFDETTGEITRLEKGTEKPLFTLSLGADNLYYDKISGNIVKVSVTKKEKDFVPKIDNYVSTQRTSTNKLILVKKDAPINKKKSMPVAITPVDNLPAHSKPEPIQDSNNTAHIILDTGENYDFTDIVSPEQRLAILETLASLDEYDLPVYISDYEAEGRIRKKDISYRDLFVNIQEEIERIKTNCYS